MKEGREGKRVEVRERKKEAEPDRLRLEAMGEKERQKPRCRGERSNWKTRSRTGLIKINTAPTCYVFVGLIIFGQAFSVVVEARQISE